MTSRLRGWQYGLACGHVAARAVTALVMWAGALLVHVRHGLGPHVKRCTDRCPCARHRRGRTDAFQKARHTP